MRIDVHAHYWPKAYLELLHKLGRTDLPMQAAQAADFADRIAVLDKAGIDVQILSAIGLDTQIADRQGALEAARAINDIYAEVKRDHKGRFDAFGWVPLPFVGEAIEEARRCLDDLGFAGIGVASNFQGRMLDDPEFEPFWAELDARRAVVFIHPVGSHSCCHPGLDKYGLDIAFGSPVQMATAVARLVYSGVRARHANIRFVVASCGGVLPFFWPRIADTLKMGLDGVPFFSWVKRAPIDPQDPMSEFRQFWYDTSVEDLPFGMALAKQAYGADRIVFGSDAIFGQPDEVIAYIERSDVLTADEKRAILDENAARVLNL